MELSAVVATDVAAVGIVAAVVEGCATRGMERYRDTLLSCGDRARAGDFQPDQWQAGEVSVAPVSPVPAPLCIRFTMTLYQKTTPSLH